MLVEHKKKPSSILHVYTAWLDKKFKYVLNEGKNLENRSYEQANSL